MARTLVTTWFGAFLLDGQTLVRSVLAPADLPTLQHRLRERRRGTLTPEETSLISERAGAAWVTRDRRLVSYGLRFDPRAAAFVDPVAVGIDPALGRLLLLGEGETDLADAWDPSVHVQEAVRAVADLDGVRNLVGERLGSWASRDRPDLDPGDHTRAARVLAELAPPGPLSPTDPALGEARRRLAELYREVESTRAALAAAVDASSPAQTPNLSALLGPELAARLVAQAGGLERLARLPSSTVQVLGAERAFFEHLRGRAPPPRHGLLFTHPALQSAPRRERGKLARALAGKAAIAARMDAGGAPVAPALAAAFEARRAELKARRGRPSSQKTGRSGVGLPLDRASGDR